MNVDQTGDLSSGKLGSGHVATCLLEHVPQDNRLGLGLLDQPGYPHATGRTSGALIAGGEAMTIVHALSLKCPRKNDHALSAANRGILREIVDPSRQKRA